MSSAEQGSVENMLFEESEVMIWSLKISLILLIETCQVPKMPHKYKYEVIQKEQTRHTEEDEKNKIPEKGVLCILRFHN